MSGLLSSLGRSAHTDSLFETHAPSNTVLGRVLSVHRGQADVALDDGPVRAFTLHHDTTPAVGDWVCVEPSSDVGIPPIIRALLPRTTAFSRKVAGRRSDTQVVAANIDRVFVAMGLDQDLSATRLHRYLGAVAASGADATVLFTKADVAAPATLPIVDVPTLLVSSITHQGIQAVRELIPPGTTAAILGASGTGKSTLVNALLGDDVQDTGGVRLSDDRGKHTTTSRVLLQVPGAGCLIDTPGMRELGLDIHVDADEVFADIAALAQRCRYRNCKHTSEPGCAVQQAIAEGSLDAARLVSRNKVKREVAHEQRRVSPHAQRKHARDWHKNIAEIQRFHRSKKR